MDDSADFSEHEDTLEIASKDWNRTVRTAVTTGYRLGAEDGSDSVFQEGFNVGYKEAFKFAFLLGKYRGILTSMSKDISHLPDIDLLINNNSGKNMCYICKKESENNSIDNDVPLTEILDQQKIVSKDNIEKLNLYVDPIIKKCGITIEEVNT